MAILSSVRVHLKILGIVPFSDKDLPAALREFKSVINFGYNLFWHFSLATYSLTVMCFMMFGASTFLEYAETTFFWSVTFLHFVSHEILLHTRSKLHDLFKDSDEMVQKRSIDPEVRLIYNNQNEDLSQLSKSLLKSGLIFAEVFLFPNTFASFFFYYTTELGEDAFRPLFPSMIPWNWKTPSGYVIVVCIQYIWIHCGIFSVISTVPLFAGFCSLFGAFTLDIKKAVTDFNDSIVEARQKFFAKNRLKLYKQLTEIISFHSDAKKLTERYSEIYSSLIAVSFAVSSVFLCSSLLGLNASISIADLLRFLVCLCVMMIYLVLLCFMGDDVTIGFRTVHDSIWECTWYELPLQSQKLFPMMLAAAQKPVYIEGYMNTRCTREAVKKLLNAAVSYFMVLREFDN